MSAELIDGDDLGLAQQLLLGTAEHMVLDPVWESGAEPLRRAAALLGTAREALSAQDKRIAELEEQRDATAVPPMPLRRQAARHSRSPTMAEVKEIIARAICNRRKPKPYELDAYDNLRTWAATGDLDANAELRDFDMDAEAVADALATLLQERDELREALSKISRMKLFPDDFITRTSLAAAIRIASEQIADKGVR